MAITTNKKPVNPTIVEKEHKADDLRKVASQIDASSCGVTDAWEEAIRTYVDVKSKKVTPT